MDQGLYDTIIIGGGPAAAAAAIYAGRKRLKTLVIAEQFGGQSTVSSNIENWIGELSISGMDLSEKLKKHVAAQGGIEIKEQQKVTGVTEGPNCTYEVKSGAGASYRSKTLIIASGARRRRLRIPGEDRFDGKGVAFCSTCDAPLYSDADVAVAGSGNSALETVVDLLPYAKKIYLIFRGEELKGDPINQEKVTHSAKVQIIKSAEMEEIFGNQSVTGLRYKEEKSGVKELAVSGVFIEIGLIPNSEFIRTLIDVNEAGEIIVDHATGKTSRPGIFAAGDVTNDPFKQNNIAAGDGVRAALSAYDFVLNLKKYSPCAENGE